MLPHQKILREIILIIRPICKRYENKNVDFPTERFFIHLLERTCCGLFSLHKLSSNNITTHNHAIGLISRCILTDLITTCFLVHKHQTSKKEMQDWIYSLLNQDIEMIAGFMRVLDSSETAQQEINTIHNRPNSTEKFIKDYLDDVSPHDIDNFSPNTLEYSDRIKQHKKLLQDFPSTKKIIGKLKSEKSILATVANEAFDRWIFLSKYEHVGYYSYGFTRNDFVKKDMLHDIFNQTLHKSIILTGLCCQVLELQDESKKLEILAKALANK